MFDSKLIFLEKLLGKSKYSHNTKEAEFYCCFCFHYKKKLSVNVENDNWKCWVCNKAGKSLVYLIRTVGTPLDVETYIKSYKAKDVVVREFGKEEFFTLKLPKDFMPLMEAKETVYGKRAWKYLTSRGVLEEDIFRYKMGLTHDKRYENRIILPSFDKDGYLNFFTARFVGKGSMSYLDPDMPRGFKNHIIFNELNIDWQKPVVLTEGYFDMINAVNAIPLFGSSLRNESAIFQTIVKKEATVFLAGDSDAKSKFGDIAKLFMDWGISVYNVDVSPFKDVGEMSKDEFRLRYDAATPITRETLFRQKLRAMW